MDAQFVSRRFYALAIAVFVIWGTQHPALKVLAGSMSPGVLNLARFTLAALFLLPFVLGRTSTVTQVATAAERLRMMGLGVIGIGLFGLAATAGISHSTASNSAVLVNTHPMLTALLAPLLAGEKESKRLLWLVAAGFTGVLLVVTDGFRRSDLLQDSYFYGNCLLLLGAILISLYTVYLRPYAKKFGGLIPTFYAICGGVIFLFLTCSIQGTLPALFHVSFKEFCLLLYVAGITTALGWVVWFKAVGKLGAARGTSFIFLTPVSGIAFSSLLLGEQLSLPFLAGACVSLCSVILILRDNRPK